MQLYYRKIIDSRSEGSWEKLVFTDSYQEFRMQFQYFDQEKKYSSFSELINKVPAAANLELLVSAAVTPYLQQLENRIPDIADNLGRICLNFEKFRFEIINSDINRPELHQIAINFFTGELHWFDTIGQLMLLSQPGTGTGDDFLPVSLVEIRPFLSIVALKEP